MTRHERRDLIRRKLAMRLELDAARRGPPDRVRRIPRWALELHGDALVGLNMIIAAQRGDPWPPVHRKPLEHAPGCRDASCTGCL